MKESTQKDKKIAGMRICDLFGNEYGCWIRPVMYKQEKSGCEVLRRGRVSVVVGRSMIVSRKKKGIRWDGWKRMKTSRQTLSPENGRRNLHRAPWPKYRIEKNISYGNGARSSPFSVPIIATSVGEHVQLQVGP